MNRVVIKRIVQAGAFSLIGLGLASCGGGNSSVSTTTPVTTSTPLEDQFGVGFGVRFRTAANTTATKPAASDIIAVSLTTPPVALH